jgi:hypothetical protein
MEELIQRYGRMFQIPASEGTGAPPVYHSRVICGDRGTLTCYTFRYLHRLLTYVMPLSV